MPRRLSFTRLSLPQQPLVFIALSFITGLLAASRIQFSTRAWLIAGIILWASTSIALLARRSAWSIAILLFTSSFACGCALWAINEGDAAEDRLRRQFDRGELTGDEPVEIVGRLDNAPEPAPERIYLSVTVERISAFGRERSASGAAQIVVPLRDDLSVAEYAELKLEYGSRVRLLGHLSNRRGYRNPGAPDFDRMLEHRGFDVSGWVKSPLLVENLGPGSRSAVLHLLYSARERALAVTLRRFTQPASGILAAALFGNRHFLSQNTADVFRAGGTFHLLVISGLHVAMIALVALWLVRMLSNSRAVQYSVVIALMWAYALMVGAQPSIARSVVMLSIALIGQLVFRESIGANTLAASAIALLAWQPRDIFNPGFQLSFLTVLIIVVLTSPLYSRLRKIGQWEPSASTPYPPRVPRQVKWLAETLFWDERKFREEMERAPIRYRLDKARAAIALNLLRAQPAVAWIAVTLLTTTGVQIGLLPLMIHYFHRVSVVSPVANVVEGALVFLLMIAGAACLLIHSVLGAAALKLAPIVNATGWITVRAAEPMVGLRGASFRVPDFGENWEFVFAAYFAAVLALIVVVNEWNPFRKGDEPAAARRRLAGRAASFASIAAIVVIGWLLVAHPFAHEFERGRLAVTFLDVGQGDSMLITFPGGSLMLLDSGGRAAFAQQIEVDDPEEVFVEDRAGIGEIAVMPYLWRRGIKRLDWIAASHGDADHVEGFDEVVDGFEIARALKGASARDETPGSIFDRAVAASRAPLRGLKRGDSFEVEGALVETLSPFANPGEPPMSDNNESLVLRVGYGNRNFLLTGDVEKEAETRLAGSESDLRADVLKVAHHGSKTSSTMEFLERVKPAHAVISVAELSPFGHPHAEALDRLRVAGAQIWRTSECGTVTISTDGRDLRVETFVRCGSDTLSGGKASRSSPGR